MLDSKKKLQKMKSIFQKTSFLLLLFSLLACVKDKNFSAPTIECSEPQLTVTNTIQQVKDMYTFGGVTIISNDFIIEGYVVSNDKSGNIYKTISIQDKPVDPTQAIKINIDQTNLYTKYNIGRKIYIKLKGLAVGYSYGSIQIGKAVRSELGRIPDLEVDNYIIRSCDVETITPKKVAISDLNSSMLEMLIELDNVQFNANELGKSYGNIDNTNTVNRTLESVDSNCNLLNQISVRNSGYATFKNELLPEGKGSVVAVLGNYYEDFQLYLNSTDAIKLTETRCNYDALVANISIDEVKKMYQGTMVEIGVTNNYIIEGYVVSSDEFGNFQSKLVLQDSPENPTAGIQLLIDNSTIFQQYKIGDKVVVKLNKLYMNRNDGVLAIGYPKGTKVVAIPPEDVGSFLYNTNQNFEIKPTEITINQILNSEYENTLVKVTNVQLVANELGSAFTYFSGTSNGTRTLETCSVPEKLTVFTNGTATFANDLFPQGNGAITGVLTTNLELRTDSDVQFNNTYETCEVIIPKILITEVADPINDVSARFVELYNAGTTTINLTGWKLNKYVNGATTISSSSVDLSGITIDAGGFVIIANTSYKTVFNDTPDIESTYISGNGDDVYELADNKGATEDIFGVIGEDGNGTNWEYLDGRAVRNSTITEPNTNFNASEWTIYSDTANLLITNPNSPQTAPSDFNPRIR